MRYPLLSFLLLLTTLLAAQPKPKPADFGIKSKKALQFYLDGLQQDQWRDRPKAVANYEQALILEPTFAEAWLRLGIDLYAAHRYDQSLVALQKADSLKPAITQAEGGGVFDFYLAECLFHSLQYSEAIPFYQSFLSAGQGPPHLRAMAVRQLENCNFASEAIKSPYPFALENLGPNVNTDGNEGCPYLTADDQTLLYTTLCRTCGMNEDFFISTRDANAWKPGQSIGPPVNSPMAEGVAAMSQDGKVIVWTGCNYPNNYGSCDLYWAFRQGDSWSQPENLGALVNTNGWEGHPSLSHDGKWLYFSAGRPGGQGGKDIWVTHWNGDFWEAPKNLGEGVNSGGDEITPFIHADGNSLYFSSNGHPGFGGEDMFVSYRDRNGAWGKAQNMGYPLNTPEDESSIFVNANGTKGYIASEREGGYGRKDIYTFDMPQMAKPQIASTFLRGFTRDSVTHVPVPARVVLIDLATGDTVRRVRSGRTDGRFLMSLPLDREYAAFVQADGYAFSSKHFYLKDLSAGASRDTFFDLTLDLNKFRKNTTIVLRNIFFASGSAQLLDASTVELQFLADLLTDRSSMKIEIMGHTDNVGSQASNQTLSQARADAVRTWLIAKGIDAQRVVATGYGETRPVADNATPEGRQQNRRTEFRVLEL